MIKVACLSFNNTNIPNFSHDEIIIEYYDNDESINYERYNFIIILNDLGNVDVLKCLKKIRAIFEGIVYIIDYEYNKIIIKDIFEYKVDDYLTYPLENEYLIQKILSDNKRFELKLLNYYQMDTLVIDFNAYTIFVDLEEVELTNLEFELLKLLINHLNKALTKYEIMSEVWGYEGGDFRTIETHIKTLRRKLGRYKDNIVTIWSYGYAFMEKSKRQK